MANAEPWYGVRLIYRLMGSARQAYEERVLIVRADSFEGAISQAEEYSREYDSQTTQYIGYAMAFNIFDADGEALAPGTEVFSLIRQSDLEPNDYIDRFHDTGSESARDST